MGVAALQLSTMLREPDEPRAAEATPPHVAEAWLYEKPAAPHRTPETTPSAAKRPRSPAASESGASHTPEAAPTREAPDAGTSAATGHDPDQAP
jgi:hypothetical protein